MERLYDPLYQLACCFQILAETLDNLHQVGLDDPFC